MLLTSWLCRAASTLPRLFSVNAASQPRRRRFQSSPTHAAASLNTMEPACEQLEPRLVLSGADLSSLQFNGADQYVQIPDSSTLRPQNGVTVEAWVQFASVSDGQIVAKPFGPQYADSYSLWYQNGLLQGSINYGPDHVEYQWTPTLNTWYHLAFTFDGASHEYRLYINGSQVASKPTASSLTYDAHPVLIGVDIDNGEDALFFNGLIDNVRIWNTARSGASIAVTDKTVLPIGTPGLLAQWTFSEGSGGTTADTSGNGQTGFLGVGVHSPSWIRENAPTNEIDIAIHIDNSVIKPANSSTSITFQYQLKGNPGPFLVQVFRSSDAALDSNDILAGTKTINAKPGTSGTVAIKYSPKPTVNDYTRPFLIVVADPTSINTPRGAINEADEANNTAVIGKYAAYRNDQTLGKLSEKYESGGRGPGAVSSGIGDAGGVSYGVYQFSSRTNGKVGGTVSEFVAEFYPTEFSGLTPGTDKFSAKWRLLANRNPTKFRADQHTFIYDSLFTPAETSLFKGIGLDLTYRSNTLRDVVWSVAVQHRGNTLALFRNALLPLLMQKPIEQINDYTIITRLYAERGRTEHGVPVYFSNNSPTVWPGIIARMRLEGRQAVNELYSEVL